MCVPLWECRHQVHRRLFTGPGNSDHGVLNLRDRASQSKCLLFSSLLLQFGFGTGSLWCRKSFDRTRAPTFRDRDKCHMIFSEETQVGEAVRYDSLSVFPLFGKSGIAVDYLLSDEAIRSGQVTVEEIDQAGSVPDLMVENKGDVRVLFLEGEELVGAKQNRILNTSILVAAGSKIKIPVSCVEQGRWRYRSQRFRSSGSHSPSKLRYALKASVARSAKEKRGHRSDQSKVWEEVERQQRSFGVCSETVAMSDTFDSHREKIARFQNDLRYVDGALGMIVAVGAKVVALDMFDRPSTCRKVWNRLLTGFAIDALEGEQCRKPLESIDAKTLLDVFDNASWEQVETVGEGEERRAETQIGQHASVLSVGGVVVHASVLAGR